MGRLRPAVPKPIGINETKEMLVEKFDEVPIQKTYTCNPQEFDYLDRPQNKLRVPMHYVLKNDKANQLGVAPLPYGKVRIFIEGGGENAQASTAFLGEDWGKFTPDGRRDEALPRRRPGHRRQADDRQERDASGSPAICTTRK